MVAPCLMEVEEQFQNKLITKHIAGPIGALLVHSGQTQGALHINDSAG